MRIWLVTIGEPVPVGAGFSERLHRAGYFAYALAKAGHKVVWWTSAFDHFRKSFLDAEQNPLTPLPNLDIKLLHGCGYTRNVSLARLRDHELVARQFAELARRSEKPDLILCSYPAIELSAESVRYANEYGIPVILDVRDLWPDSFVNYVPKGGWWLAKMFLRSYFNAAKAAFSNATGIVGITQEYLDWGLKYAGRRQHDKDSVFPLCYPSAGGSVADKSLSAEFENMGVDPDCRMLLFVGTMGTTHDLKPCILAAKDLERINCQVVVCGDGENIAQWKKMSVSFPNIIFTGWLDRPHMAFLLSRAWLGIAAYAKNAPQGLPNKIFEYMSYGIPIVSSLQGDARELIARNNIGITYTPGSSESFIKAVQGCSDPDTHAAMSVNAKVLFKANYSAEKVYKDFERHLVDVYEAYKPSEGII